MPRGIADEWRARNHSKIGTMTNVDKLLTDLRESRWKTVAKEEPLSTEIVWEWYIRAFHLYAELHTALEQAETEEGTVVKQESTTRQESARGTEKTTKKSVVAVSCKVSSWILGSHYIS
jgi:hypothetical protein